MGQILRCVKDPATGLLTRYDRALRGPAMAPWRSKLPSSIDRAGRFYSPLEVGLGDGLTHNAYLHYALDGRALDSLTVPVYPTARSGWAWVQTSPNGGRRMVGGLSTVPFHHWPDGSLHRRGP